MTAPVLWGVMVFSVTSGAVPPSSTQIDYRHGEWANFKGSETEAHRYAAGQNLWPPYEVLYVAKPMPNGPPTAWDVILKGDDHDA